MYKIARLVLSEKNIHKDKKNNMMRKCIILSSKEPHLFIKYKDNIVFKSFTLYLFAISGIIPA